LVADSITWRFAASVIAPRRKEKPVISATLIGTRQFQGARHWRRHRLARRSAEGSCLVAEATF